MEFSRNIKTYAFEHHTHFKMSMRVLLANFADRLFLDISCYRPSIEDIIDEIIIHDDYSRYHNLVVDFDVSLVCDSYEKVMERHDEVVEKFYFNLDVIEKKIVRLKKSTDLRDDEIDTIGWSSLDKYLEIITEMRNFTLFEPIHRQSTREEKLSKII
jgi:hypothetical protein